MVSKGVAWVGGLALMGASYLYVNWMNSKIASQEERNRATMNAVFGLTVGYLLGYVVVPGLR